MITKVQRLSSALWVQFVKRLPYIGFVLVALILFQVYQTGADVAENVEISRQNSEGNQVLLEKISGLSEDNKRLSQDSKKLSEDNKALSEQNNRLADQSNRYLNCIALLFAEYTRTYQPIYIVDLDTCAAENIIFGSGETGTQGSPSMQSEPTPAPSPTQPQQATPAPQTPQSPLPPQAAPQAQQNALDRLLNIPKGILKNLQALLL